VSPHALTACKHTVSGSLSLPATGVLFTVPSRYSSTIGRAVYLALEGGPPSFPQGSPCPVVLGCNNQRLQRCSTTGLSPPLVRRSRTLRLHPCHRRDCRVSPRRCPTTQLQHRTRPVPLKSFGLIPFRSPLLRESHLISLPPGTEMVQFPGSASLPYSFQTGIPAHDDRWVPPFGYPWISACLQLPRAFRSSPRPSSPQRAKASTVCSSFP
jgi:hypothetical protein